MPRKSQSSRRQGVNYTWGTLVQSKKTKTPFSHIARHQGFLIKCRVFFSFRKNKHYQPGVTAVNRLNGFLMPSRGQIAKSYVTQKTPSTLCWWVFVNSALAGSSGKREPLSDWLLGKSVEHFLINDWCKWLILQSTVGSDISGLVVLGCIRKKVEWTTGASQEAASPHSLYFSSQLQVPTLISCPDFPSQETVSRTQKLKTPFSPKLLSIVLFITATKCKLG